MKTLFFKHGVLRYFARPNSISDSEKRKLLDTVIFYVPENPSIFYKIKEKIKSWRG